MLSSPTGRYHKSVVIWLWIGVAMIAVQVLVGGITRLTGSGLSITKWEIVTGTLPPLSADDWNSEFDLYKATPQYEKINQGMSLQEFKVIYFWEYFHRLWARLFGLVFAIPFFIFLARRLIDRALTQRMAILVALGAVVATFGWIMVASGLVERPWVDAYKLTLHLNLGLLLYGLTVWTALFTADPSRSAVIFPRVRKVLVVFLGLLVFQLLLGGLMSGMKAGLYYPTWPEMNDQWIPAVLTDTQNWTLANMGNYDTVAFAPALIQFFHRLLAYALFVVGGVIWWRINRSDFPAQYKLIGHIFMGTILLQVIIGIITVINCVGELPLFWGVAHQGGAILLLSSAIALLYYTKSE